jgi:hypothetical protein
MCHPVYISVFIKQPSPKVCVESATPSVKQLAKEEMWSSANGLVGTGGKPMRYPQQQELMDMVSS